MSIQRLLILVVLFTLPLASYADPQAGGGNFSVALQNTLSNAVSQAVIEMAKMVRDRKTSYRLTDRPDSELDIICYSESGDGTRHYIDYGPVEPWPGLMAEAHSPAHKDVLDIGREMRFGKEIFLTPDTNKVQVSFVSPFTPSDTYVILLTNSSSGWHHKKHQFLGCSLGAGDFIDRDSIRKK